MESDQAVDETLSENFGEKVKIVDPIVDSIEKKGDYDRDIIQQLNQKPNVPDFFEKQNSRDCVIHSLNNAHGRVVVTKPEIMSFIDKTIEKYEKNLIKKGQSAKVVKKKAREYRKKLADKDTYFSAELVWKTAQNSGAVGDFVQVAGYAYEYADVNKTFMSWARKLPVVVLGENGKERHAIAVRNEMIYDSENKKPLPLTNENMKKSLDVVYGAYAFLPPPSSKVQI